MLTLKGAAKRLCGEYTKVIQSKLAKIGHQIEREIDGDRAKRRVLVLAPVVSRIRNRQEDQRSAWRCPVIEESLQRAVLLQVAAWKRLRGETCCCRRGLAPRHNTIGPRCFTHYEDVSRVSLHTHEATRNTISIHISCLDINHHLLAMASASLRGLDSDDCDLLVRALVGDETQWLFSARADETKWSTARAHFQQHGYGVIDGFLGAKLSLALREQAVHKFADAATDFEHINGQFAKHGLCSTRLTELDSDDASVTFMPYLTKQCEQLVHSLIDAGVSELRTISHRSRPMLAVYPSGGRYMRHVDNTGGNGRLLVSAALPRPCFPRSAPLAMHEE